jgi:hypothetical protein
MTHGTIIQSVYVDGRAFIIIIHEDVLFYTLRQQNSSIHQLTLNACESCHSHLPKYFYRPHPDISLSQMKLKECQNMIYLNLRRFNLFATVTNKRNRVAEELADDFIERYESGEICRLEFVSKLSYRYKKE